MVAINPQNLRGYHRELRELLAGTGEQSAGPGHTETLAWLLSSGCFLPYHLCRERERERETQFGQVVSYAGEQL